MRAIFGLRAVQRTKDGDFKISLFQRILATIWVALFIADVLLSQEEDLKLDLNIKNTLIAHVLPKITGTIATLSLLFTYILTHAFAQERKRRVEEVMKLCPHLDMKSVNASRAGTNYIIAVGLLQSAYGGYWFYTVLQYTTELSSSYLPLLVVTLPKFVAACFFVDYVTATAVLIQQFKMLNGQLKEMRVQSLKTKHYPTNERSFQEKILKIVDQHYAFCKIGARMNDLYSFQLLLNISVAYSSIVTSAYIGLWSLIFSLTENTSLRMVVISGMYLMFNVLTLLVVVKITTQLYKEVSQTLLSKKN